MPSNSGSSVLSCETSSTIFTAARLASLAWAAAFAAYTTLSVLTPRFLPVELAVRTILSQFACDANVFKEATGRAVRDAMQLPDELVDRIRYVFAAPGDTDPA